MTKEEKKNQGKKKVRVQQRGLRCKRKEKTYARRKPRKQRNEERMQRKT